MRLRAILSHVRLTQNLQIFLRQYRYDPLPSGTSIRLLRILPSEDRRVIQCSLETFELEDAPPFRALSYTWGRPFKRIKPSPNEGQEDPALGSSRIGREEQNPSISPGQPQNTTGSRRHSIYCNGCVLKVTNNLRDALRMLVRTMSAQSTSAAPQYFWIDSLCMNQQNVLERNAQVARMAEIFQKAQSVVVWLGKEDEYTMDALTTIERVSAIPEEDWPSIPYTSFYSHTSHTKAYRRLNVSYHNWLGFIVFINREWFKRAWVS
jgi:hypothetical protein